MMLFISLSLGFSEHILDMEKRSQLQKRVRDFLISTPKDAIIYLVI